MSERIIIGVNESEPLFPDNTNSTINAADPVERTITGVNSSTFIVDNSTFELNPSENGGGGGAFEEEEANNEILNGRLNDDSGDYVLSGGWSFDNGALLHSGSTESELLIVKSAEAEAAQGLSGSTHRFKFDVLQGELVIKEGFHGGTNMLNPNNTAGTYGVGSYDIEVNPLAWGTPTGIPVYSSVDGTIIDNIFVDYEPNN